MAMSLLLKLQTLGLLFGAAIAYPSNDVHNDIHRRQLRASQPYQAPGPDDARARMFDPCDSKSAVSRCKNKLLIH